MQRCRNDFSIRPWTVKVLKCAECVPSASESQNHEISVRESVYLCTSPFGLSLSDCQCEGEGKRFNAIWYVSQHQVALSLCSSWCSRRVLEHQMRSVIIARFVTTKNPTMKTLTKVTMSMKTTTVQHRVLEDRFNVLSFFTCTICWHSGCASVFTVSLPPPW